MDTEKETFEEEKVSARGVGRWLVLVALHFLPGFSFFAALGAWNSFPVAYLLFAGIWFFFFFLLRLLETGKGWPWIWIFSSLFLPLLLISPGLLAFIAWTVERYLP